MGPPSDEAMATLQVFVRDLGRGLVTVGGPRAYGAGGYTDTPLEESGRPAVAIVESAASLYKTLDIMITSYKGSAIIVDEEGRYQGVVDFDTVLEATSAMHSSEQGQEQTAQDLETGDSGR